MKKLNYFYFALFLFFGFAQAQIINIPDANFKAKLLGASPSNNYAADENGNYITIDINNDNEIEVSEALLVYKLYIYSINPIADLTGINYFTNLRELECHGNELTDLDVSNLENLKILQAFDNNLTSVNISNLSELEQVELYGNSLVSLDLTGLTSLHILHCQDNNLTGLNASNLPSLEILNCYDNSLTTLNLSNSTNLKTVDCEDNNLTGLDLSGLTNLKFLYCTDNQIASIDLSEGLNNLEEIECPGNHLEALDLSNVPQLKNLKCEGNNITSLDFSNNPSLYALTVFGNPINYINIKNGTNYLSLSEINLGTGYELPENCYICVDETDVNDFDPENLTSGTFYNSYCDFSPGGNYNTIKGNILFNNEANCDEAANIQNSNFKITISNSIEGNEGVIFTNMQGEFEVHVQNGFFTLSPQMFGADNLFSVTPESREVLFPLINGSVEELSFCIFPNGNHPDVEIIITPLEPARPGFEATYEIIYRNMGNQTVSGNIDFHFNDDLMDFTTSNPLPDSQSAGFLTYDFSDLNPFETKSINLTFEINTPTDTPPVNIEDILPFTAQINIGEDESPEDNTFELNQEVVGSYDPNDILCLEGESVSPEMIGKELHYRIRFENTGNFSAERVVVAMPINPEDYDVSSFQLLNTSHNVQARIVDNTAEFFFEGIDLQPNEQGFIAFSIKSLDSLMTGDSVMSYADIYFDYNYPVTTNEAETIFELMATENIDLDNQVSIYPNPAQNQFNIQSGNKIELIEIYDVSGRLIQVSKLNSNTAVQDISKIPIGVYFLKVRTHKGTIHYKLIKK